MIQTTITEKQQEIVTLIPRFRFLDRTHIQSFLHHKDKQRINKWLKDLTTKQYVRRIYDDKIIGSNRRSAIFSLEKTGIRFIKAQGVYEKTFLHALYYEKNRSDTFIDHCLMIATICCELEKKKNEIVYVYTTASDFSDPKNQFHFFKEVAVKTDLLFSKKEQGKQMKYFLLSLFDKTLPKYRIRNRIREYREFYFTNEWENNLNVPFPTLLFLCATKELMIYIKRYTKTIRTGEEDTFFIHVATVADAKTDGITGQIWEKV